MTLVDVLVRPSPPLRGSREQHRFIRTSAHEPRSGRRVETHDFTDP
jgi:hypothetical protein